MSYRRMISAVTLMAFVGCLLAFPVTAQAQNFFNNNQRGNSGFNIWNDRSGSNSFMSHGGGIGQTLLHLIPGVLGGVAGYFLGASLGPIGRIAAAAVGFVVAKWIADKLFPNNGYNRYTYNDFNRNFNFGVNNQYQSNNGFGWGPRGSETGGATGGDSNLQAVRDRWITATREYQNSLSGTDQTAIGTARSNFESARQAYFDSIRSNYNH
ncbi:MAG: hypothetical protein HY303_03490 [Candidatus Wallbacteria bacterium]|nr:hypothetical protein [Candidatus Wallbacteria bacterium]